MPMRARAIDHVNIRIPEDGVESALDFYKDCLGLAVENLDQYRNGERTIFSFRLGERSVIHIRPVESIEPPAKENYDHFAITVEEGIDQIKSRLQECEVSINREGNPLGAEGRNPAVYVTDPFGYIIEIKEAKR